MTTNETIHLKDTVQLQKERESELRGWYRMLEALDGGGEFERQHASSMGLGGRYVRGGVPKAGWTRARMEYLQGVIRRAADAMAEIGMEDL
jgi:hypothetical protein